MLLAVDVHYEGSHALAGGVLFRRWSDGEAAGELTVPASAVADYRPGRFYLRELPCIMALVAQLDDLPVCIIVDGHVYLDAARTPGLGRRLYDALGGKAAVVGVAKSRLAATPPDAAVFRGASSRPLYVTAAGMAQAQARRRIAGMHGPFRLPAMLKRADRLCRGHCAAAMPGRHI